MKIAVLSDIHGNYTALEAVTDHVERWHPDWVWIAGDIVNRGPRSFDCFEFLKEKQRDSGWQIIRGNHEDYLLSRLDPDDPESGPTYELFQPVHFAYRQFNHDLSEIQVLPTKIVKAPPGMGEIRMVHASMRGNRDGIYPETQDETLQKQIAPAPAVFIMGHTHRPLVRTLDQCLVVNAGSAGLPFDGDTRPSYAQVVWDGKKWDAEIVRIKYDIDQAEQDFYTSGYVEGAGPLAELMLLELKTGYSQLYQWTSRYTPAVLSSKITVAEAVQEFLEDPIFKPYW